MAPVEAESLQSLAGKLGIDAEGLVDTVRQYNISIQDGKCLSLTPPKTNFAQPIDAPPYCAYKVTGGFTSLSEEFVQLRSLRCSMTTSDEFPVYMLQ